MNEHRSLYVTKRRESNVRSCLYAANVRYHSWFGDLGCLWPTWFYVTILFISSITLRVIKVCAEEKWFQILNRKYIRWSMHVAGVSRTKSRITFHHHCTVVLVVDINTYVYPIRHPPPDHSLTAVANNKRKEEKKSIGWKFYMHVHKFLYSRWY